MDPGQLVRRIWARDATLWTDSGEEQWLGWLDEPGRMRALARDLIEFADAAAVPLTSVRQPRRALGRQAAELLIEEATDPEHRHQQVVFTPELVVRRSTLDTSAGFPISR